MLDQAAHNGIIRIEHERTTTGKTAGGLALVLVGQHSGMLMNLETSESTPFLDTISVAGYRTPSTSDRG